MQATDLQISWSNFSGGIADQKYQAPPGRYYRGWGVDTTGFGVIPTSTPELINTYESNVNAIFAQDRINSTGNTIVWTNDGKIYENTTPRATITGSASQGYNIGYMKPTGSSVYKLYYFHYTVPTTNPKYIHRSNEDGTGFIENHLSYTADTGNANIAPPVQPNGMIVLSEGNRILFSYYNTIWQLSNSEVLTKLIEFPSEQNVVGITEFLGEYKIYTTSGFSTSRVYRWDGLSDLPDLSIDLQGLAITGGVANLGANDYFIADNSFYQVSGVQYQELYRNISGRIVTAYDNKVIIELRNESDEKYILAEYSNKPGYSKGIHPIQIIDIKNPTSSMRSIDYSQNGLIFARGAKLYEQFGTSEAPTTGTVDTYIESLNFIGDNIQYRKKIDNVIFKFTGFTTQNISFYVEINDSGIWIKIWEGNNNSVSSTNYGIKLPSNSFLNQLGNFNTIRFKAIMSHNGTRQGKFYGIDLFGKQDVGQ